MAENKKTNLATVRFSSGVGNTLQIKFPKVKQKEDAIKDIYIDAFSAKVYINYGKKDCDVRAIDSPFWYQSEDMPIEQRNEFLIENSKIVKIDNEQIQDMLQEIHIKTNYSENKGKEHQIFICLERPTAIIKAFMGLPGTNRNCVIPYKFIDGDAVVDVDNTRKALLGQAHTHPELEQKEKHTTITTGDSFHFGEEEKEENAFGTSSDDADSAKEIKIYIYALDSCNFSKRPSKVSIHRVSPTGQKKKVGTTKGDGTAKNTVNIGLECLNLKIGR